MILWSNYIVITFPCPYLIPRLERIKEAEERDEADPDDDSNVRTHFPC